jgi:hypothetical protein
VASIKVLFPSENTLTAVSRQTTDNLPAHVKGNAQWDTVGTFTGYYIPAEHTKNNKPAPTEFINNGWFALIYIESQQAFFTRSTHCIARENTYGLGFWNLTDPEHPDYVTPEPLATDPTESPSYGPVASSRPISRASSIRALSHHSQQNSPTIQTQTLFTSFPSITLSSMSVNTTAPTGGSGGGGGTGTVTAPPHSNGGMQGVPLSVFDRTRSQADEFWVQFRCYKLVNRTHDSMTKPFDQVLTVLMYI